MSCTRAELIRKKSSTSLRRPDLLLREDAADFLEDPEGVVKAVVRELIEVSSDLGVTTGLSSPSFPYFAVEPLVFLRHVEGPEGVPLAVQVGGS